MAVIRCPNCSKPNPDFLEVCQYCEARLHVEGAAPLPASADDTFTRSGPPAPRPPATPSPAAPEDEPDDNAPLNYLDRLRMMQAGANARVTTSGAAK